MSGLEPLAALGLACNILQLIEVGGTTIKLAKTIYQSSSPAIDQSLQDNAAVLSTISSQVKAAKRPASLSRLDQQLINTADKCSTAARDLEEETVFLLRNAKQNQLATTLKVVAKTTWRKRRLDRLKQTLENAENLMMKTILAQIWSRTCAAELDLSNVKDDLRAFVQQYQSGTRDTKKLVSSEHLVTRKHIFASAQETLEAIDGVQKKVNKMTIDADMQVDQTKRERLLRSLKFPAFNERRNQLAEAHESTFEWIFIGDDGPSHENLEGSDLEDSDWEDSDLEELDLADPSEASWDLFSNWLSSTAEVYWISGKPGSGKTTLVKYVLEHPRTMTYLKTWSPQALIISHYFWRPGNSMQQSIKGLLCSLLYQLLDQNPAATKFVLQARDTGTKDVDTDWSVPELHSNLFQILSTYDRPICIFIDGLDEVDPTEGPIRLLELVLQFPRCGNVKLCLSSRPEPILEDHLSAYPHLRVQDLTRPDLEQYARDHLKASRPAFGQAPLAFDGLKANRGIRLINSLVDKAQGVFLWLILAIKSINKGFTFEDTADMIEQRIQSLPRDLTSLYKDMWNRAGEDSPVAYRQIAALYFRLLLIRRDGPLPSPPFFPSLLHLALASTSLADDLLEAIGIPSKLVPEETLLRCCREIERRLKLYCFGLIETIVSSRESSVVGWYGCQYNRFWSQIGHIRIDFIHRTARDFLLDTVDGAEILKHDSRTEASLFYTWIRAHLAINLLFAGEDDFGTVPSNVDNYRWLLRQFPRGGTCSGDPDRSRTISHIEKLCNTGQLLCGHGDLKRLCGGEDFFKATASIQDEYTLPRQRLSTLSKATISEVLLNVAEGIIAEEFETARKDSAEPLIMVLLSEGADPNWHGHAFNPGYDARLYYSDIRTPFTEYLNALLWNTRRPLGKEWITHMVKNLYGFLSYSANLNDTMYQVLHWRPFANGLYETDWHFKVKDAIRCMEPVRGPGLRWEQYGDLVVAFPTWNVVKVLLDGLDTEHLWGVEDLERGDMMSLLARTREHLDNWSTREDGHVIGLLTYEEIEKPNQNAPMLKRAWYVPMEDDSVGTLKKLTREVEECLLNGARHGDGFADRIIQLVQQLSWTARTVGKHEICESLTELGIMAPHRYETGDTQYWVDKFQETLGSYKQEGCG